MVCCWLFVVVHFVRLQSRYMWVHVFKQKLMCRLCQMLLWVAPVLAVLEGDSVHWVYFLQLVCICGWLSCSWMLFERGLCLFPFHVSLVTITDFEFLLQGVTAVLNFQSGVETENWGINSNSINQSCQRSNILMINYPIR